MYIFFFNKNEEGHDGHFSIQRDLPFALWDVMISKYQTQFQKQASISLLLKQWNDFRMQIKRQSNLPFMKTSLFQAIWVVRAKKKKIPIIYQTHLNLITPQMPHLQTPSHWGLGFNIQFWGFPDGTTGKEPACQCRRHKTRGFDPWVGKAPWRRARNPLQYPCLENPMDRGAWWAAIHKAAEPDMTKVT